MESSDNEMAVSPVEKFAVPNQLGGSDGDDVFGEDTQLLGPVADQETEEETVVVASKKRGRPKKYLVHETTSGKVAEKRGRGRPRGSGNQASRTGQFLFRFLLTYIHICMFYLVRLVL